MRNTTFLLSGLTLVGALFYSLFQKNERREQTKVVRLRLSHEDLMSLVKPEELEKKPPLPENIDIDNLPSYFCGCPHCGKMSVFGENQWRYQELSRTRGPYNNTTTYLTQCRNCNQFMKSTVDHDD